MSDSQNICLSCGLCCDGTLIGFVKLDQEEISKVKKVKEVEEANGEGFFLQPCDKFCDGCTIYDDRPKQCARFECGLLESVENNEIDFNAAVTISNQVKQQRAIINTKIEKLDLALKSKSFYFQMGELKRLLKKKKSIKELSGIHKELAYELKVLDTLVVEKFELSEL